MIFQVDGGKFKKAVLDVKSGIGDGKINEFFSGIAIQAQGSIITLKTTDGTMGITSRTIGDVEEEGVFFCGAGTFIATVSQLVDDVVEISTKDDVLTLKQNKTKVKFKSMGKAEPENETTTTNGSVFSVTTKEFLLGLQSALACVATENAHPQLKGVNLSKGNDGKIRIAALDGFRLSRAYSAYTAETEVKDFNIIVPPKAIKSVIALGASTNEIQVEVCSTKVIFKIDDISIVTGLFSGQFPNVDNFFPTMFEKVYEVDKEQIQKAISITSLTCETYNCGVLLTFDGQNKELTVESRKENAESTIRIPIETVCDTKLTIMLNATFLSVFLKQIVGDKVNFNCVSEVKPIVLTEEKSSANYLILPIRAM